MDAEKYLKEQHEREVKNMDDPKATFDWRLCIYFRHVGRLEGLVMTDAISLDRYVELIDEWNQHWPGKETK